MKCRECKMPLRVLRGGQVSDSGSTDIKTIHIWGCVSKKCKLKEIEQKRTETINTSFTE